MTTLDLAADRRQFILALAATALLPAVARAAGGGYPTVQSLLDRYVAEKRVANLVVAISRRQGAPEFFSAGQLEIGAGPAAGPDTLYRIYSMTKPITGAAIMMLVEDGKLTLDTPLSAIFPAYAQMSVLTDPDNSLAARPATKPILIRHLVTHSAGLAYGSSAPAPLARLYEERGIESASATLDPQSRRPKTLTDFAEAAASVPLMFEPGSKWLYSIGLDVAGAVVEKVSGLPFDVFLQQRIFAPLGMGDTAFFVPDDKQGRFVTNYRYTLTGLEVLETTQNSAFTRKPPMPAGGSGLVSSARDYARFMAMLLGEGQLDGRRIMKTQTARTMMSNLMEPGVAATITSGPTGYGAGGRSVIDAVPGGEGVGTYGWSGAANSVAFVDRSNGVYIVLMTQVMRWPQSPIYDDFGKALYADLRA